MQPRGAARARSRCEPALLRGDYGLEVEHADKNALHLRGMEERNHHSLVLQTGAEPLAERLGFKVASEDGPRPRAVTSSQMPALPSSPSSRCRSRAARCARSDRADYRLELYFKMDQRERSLQPVRPLQGLPPAALDHFNVFAPDVQRSSTSTRRWASA